jgi:hypothetical protein
MPEPTLIGVARLDNGKIIVRLRASSFGEQIHLSQQRGKPQINFRFRRPLQAMAMRAVDIQIRTCAQADVESFIVRVMHPDVLNDVE